MTASGRSLLFAIYAWSNFGNYVAVAAGAGASFFF